MPGLFARLLRLLEHPRALPAIVALAVLVCLPTLRVGLFTDDYAHLALIERTIPALEHNSPLDLYRFIAADRTEFDSLLRFGPVPWFADPELKIHFFRPLTSALISLDHAVWGRNPIGYHLTSILLYAALVLAAGRLYRTIAANPGGMGGREVGPIVNSAAVTAMLATLLFAVDAGHCQSIAWTAARHLVVAAIPAAIGLAAVVRHVRDGHRSSAWLGPIAIIVALLASEAALGAVAYCLAYSLLGPPSRPTRSRLRESLPLLAITAVYAVAYKAAGFGAKGSGAYFDPAADPRGFALALVTRLPVLVGDYFTGIPADLVNLFPAAPFVLVGIAAAAGVVALYCLALPAIPDDERAALRWLVPGALGALILAASGFPGSRLLLFATFGFAFLVAVLLHRGAQRLAESRGVTRVGLALGFAFLVAVHLVLAPLGFVAHPSLVAELARQGLDILQRAEIARAQKTRVVVLAVSDPMVAFYPLFTAALIEPDLVRSWQVLSAAKLDHRVTRTGPSSLRLDMIGGRMMQGGFEVLVRSPRRPFAAGDRVELAGATVTVAAVDRGAPTAIDVVFDVPLDHPDLHLMTWRDGRLARLSPPPVGASVDLPWSPGPFRFF